MKFRMPDRTVHVLFQIGLTAKAVDGALELLAGVLLLVLDPRQLGQAARALTQGELSEDPHDAVATFLLHSVAHLSTATKAFAGLYLLAHGVIKVGLVTALLRRKLWGFPLALVAFGALLGYQLYRYGHTRSIWLLAVSVLDAFVMILTWLEYVRVRARRAGFA